MTPESPSHGAERLRGIPAARDAALREERRETDLKAHEMLLDRLDLNRNLAWVAYEKLRSRLTKFFECRRFSRSTDLADDVLDRVALMLLSGKEILDVAQFCVGVARMICFESSRASNKEISAEELLGLEDNLPAPRPSAGLDEKVANEHRLSCLDSCLDKLRPEDRSLLLLYYSAEGKETKRGKIENKNKDFRPYLAQFFGISAENLRVRACRLRREVEKRMSRCLESSGQAMDS